MDVTRLFFLLGNSLLHYSVSVCPTTQNLRKTHSKCSYQQGTTVLCYTEEAHQPTSLQALFGSSGGDTEGSQNSEGSHETGDSGRYSHDEIEMTNLSSGQGSRPCSLQGVDSSGGSEAEEEGVAEARSCALSVDVGEATGRACVGQQEVPEISQPALSL